MGASFSVHILFIEVLKKFITSQLLKEKLVVMKISLICRSGHPQVFYKVGVFKNFAKFTGKYQRQCLFFMNYKKEVLNLQLY